MTTNVDPGLFLVFTGGGGIDERHGASLPEAACVIAADSGLELVQSLGLHADVVVGDLDSVATAALERAVAASTEIERHPPDKDATDLELALSTARRRGARRVLVVGGDQGRLDHVLANMLSVAAGTWGDLEIEAVFGEARVWVCRDVSRLDGTPGEYLSLLAVGGPAEGVHTSGLLWSLRGETLTPGSGRGVSNEFTASHATVRVGTGTVLAVAPGVTSEQLSRRETR